MSYGILTGVGPIISGTMVQHITNLELMLDEVKQQCKDYNQCVVEILDDADHIVIPQGTSATMLQLK
jgi:glutamine amidotransferase PdxT